MGSFDQRAYSRRLVERFNAAVSARLAASVPRAARGALAAIANEALADSIAALDVAGTGAGADAGRSLPVARLSAAEVLAEGRTAMSQATLYRAADSGRCYSVTPGGRSIGKEFPAWQFVEPVPELIPAVLTCLAGQPGSEVHAFWVSAADALNELAPAELLAGCGFETRATLHPSQQALLALPSAARLKKVLEFAQQQAGGGADVIA
ncbi:MAG: hypothetical protein QFF03_05845 [Pseudomonadota bacterium]|nr:hypothetical protein [Pseudomonadota bacterium]